MDLFTLTARIGMDATEFEQGMKTTQDSMKQAKKNYNDFMSDMMKLAAQLRKEEGLSQRDAQKKAYASINKELYDMADKTKRVVDATEEVGEATGEATGKAKRHWWQLGETVKETGQQVKASTIMLGHWMYDLTKQAAGIGVSLVKTGLQYNSQMEDYTTSFRVMLGSMAEAEAKVEELKSMAANTPFAMADLAEATKELLSFNVQSDKTTSIMSRLGDVSLGNAQRFQGLVTAYGKINNAGKLTRENMESLLTNGFNPLNYIMQETGESMTELQKRMSAGAVSVDELELALRRATSEGGQYYRGMAEGAKTLSGQLSTLEESYTIILGKAMEPVNEALSNKIVPKAIESLDKLSAALFGVGEDAESAKKKLFLNTEGEEIDPSANLLTWINNLMATWTDGLTEDQTTIDSFVSQFNENTNSIRTALLARINNLSDPVSLQEMQAIETKIAQIDGMQARVETLLTKRAGGYITPDEEAELQSIIQTLQSMQTELEAATGFNDNIVTPWERLVDSASNLATDGIDKLADFFEWCAEDGENVDSVLDGIVISISGLAGMKLGLMVAGPVGGLLGFVAGTGGAAVIRNLDKIKESADAAADALERVEAVEKYGYGTGEAGARSAVSGGYTPNTSTSSGGAAVASEALAQYGSISEMMKAATKHATGLDYVPYNEYPAILHEGEAVLTKLEAQQWRSGGVGISEREIKPLVTAVRDLIAEVRQTPIVLDVDGRALAYATAGDNTRAMNARQTDINIGRLRF